MKTKLVIFEHASNGISLELIGETEAEFDLLRGLWKHGQLKTCYGHEKFGGFAIAWKIQEPTNKLEGKP